MIKKITIAALVTCMMIGFVSCGNETSKSDSQQNTIQEAENDKKVSDKAEGSADAPNENEETPAPTDAESSDDKTLPSVEVNLPKGADSVYSLYTTVTDFLNGGFHYDDLKDVYDPALVMAFYSKMEKYEEDILTYGLDLKDSYALIKRLADNADVNELPLDEEGEFDDDDIDLEALKKGLSDDMLKQLDKYPDAYEDYAENIYEYLFGFSKADGKNPFHTSQTSWEKIPESDLSVEEYDDYDDWNEDLEKAFPDIKEINLGRYEEGNEVYYMYVYCIEVDGRYYSLGFSTAVGAMGG